MIVLRKPLQINPHVHRPNERSPHAPWWTYNEEANRTESIGVTLEIAAFVLRSADPASELYQTAVRLARQMTAKLSLDTLGEMGIGGYIALWQALAEKGLTDVVDVDALAKAVRIRADAAIVRDPAKWPFYGVRPSNFIRTPDSPLYAGNEAITETELDYLLETRDADGVWPITWSWFDLNDTFPKQFAISENWWRAIKARENLLFLRAFGRVEE